MARKWHFKCQLKPLKNMFYHEIIELRCCCREWSGYARGNTAIFLVRPYLSNPRDLDFFKRNICICCSPPFYFSLFALGATSLPDQVTCRIFHFLLLDEATLSWTQCLQTIYESLIISSGDQVLHINLKLKDEEKSAMFTMLDLYALVCEAERERQGKH